MTGQVPLVTYFPLPRTCLVWSAHVDRLRRLVEGEVLPTLVLKSVAVPTLDDALGLALLPEEREAVPRKGLRAPSGLDHVATDVLELAFHLRVVLQRLLPALVVEV